MTTVLTNPTLASGFALTGKRKIAEVFSLERSVREIENLYETLAVESGRIPMEAAAR